jgi:hypothetical protein
MNKLLPAILLAIFLFFSNISYTQVSLTVNGGIQIPSGDFGNTVKSGYGFTGSLGFSIPLVPLEFSLTAGYDKWAYKTSIEIPVSGVQTIENNLSKYSIPVTIGPKLFFPIPMIGFEPYIGVDAGLVFSNSNIPGATYTSDFIYCPMVGIRYNLPLGIIAIDINVRDFNYKDSGQAISWIGINGGIAISL